MSNNQEKVFGKLKALFRAFNRKERYHLIREACRHDFGLSDEFRGNLERLLNVRIDDKQQWVAMDYHLDWVSAILFLLRQEDGLLEQDEDVEYMLQRLRNHEGWRNYLKGQNSDSGWVLEGNQQDVDLLTLARGKEASVVHLIFVEAKFDTGWTNEQLKIKGRRVGQLLPESEVALSRGFTLKCHWVFAGLKDQFGNGNVEHFPGWVSKDDDQKRPRHYISYQAQDANVLLRPERTGMKKVGGKDIYEGWHIKQAWSRDK